MELLQNYLYKLCPIFILQRNKLQDYLNQVFQNLHLPFRCHNSGIGGPEYILYGVTFRKAGNLRDQTQFLVGIDVDFAIVIVHLAGKNVEQCGFTAPVPA